MALNKKEIAVFEKLESWEISQLLHAGISIKLIDWEKVTDTLEWLACKPCTKCGTIPHTEECSCPICVSKRTKRVSDMPPTETIAPGGSNEQ